MILALPKTQSVTFEELVPWKPEVKYYELHNGVIIEMNQPLGQHEWIIIFFNEKITSESTRNRFILWNSKKSFCYST